MSTLLFSTGSLLAEQGAYITGEHPRGGSLSAHLGIYADTDGALTIAKAASAEYAYRFEKNTMAVPSFGFSQNVYWAKFTVTNPGPARMLYLRVAYPHLDSIILYEPAVRGGWAVREAGDLFLFESREIKHHDFIFRLNVQAKSSRTYFLRFKSQGVLEFPLYLTDSETLRDEDHETQIVLGVYYGILLVLAVYNLILFFIIGDRAYLYYLLYITGYGTMQLILNGLAFEYLWPESPRWENLSLPVTVYWTFFWGVFFVRKLLNTRAMTPLSDTVLAVLQTILLMLIPVSFVMSYRFAISSAAALAILFSVIVLVAGFFSLLQGYEPARYFMAAWIFVLAGVILYGLKAFGVIPSHFVTEYGNQIGSAIEMCLLSIGLANRMSVMNRDKESALKQSYRMSRLQQESEIHSVRLELELLKKNIQPHFIMNTINASIVWLEENPALAVRLLRALADELRLVLEVSNHPFISLKEEIRLCRIHLEIMSLRHDKIFRLRTQRLDMSREIPPLIIHTLIENGITHGLKERRRGIFLLTEERENESVVYSLRNNGTSTGDKMKSGTGFRYIQSRLEEAYPGRWDIESGPAEKGWTVKLKISFEQKSGEKLCEY